MENLKLKRNERGISLIALVITIIVIIILAAIAFNSSTSTISKANYSKFVSNIGEVQDAIQTKAVTVKGFTMAGGTQMTDAQAYNYVAKGGSSESDFLPEAQVPDYTIIEKTADIGIDLPEIKVNTPTETGVKVKYAVTKEGKVFIWPPYSYENEYNVRDKETVNKSLVGVEGELDIKVADKDLKIKTDEKGMLLNTTASGAGPTQEEILAKIKVGDYVNYTPTSATVQTDPSKTGYATKETLTTDTSAKWRILSIDEETGKVLITTQGPVNNVNLGGAAGYLFGPNELHRLCEKIYSNTDKGLVARSMTIEDLNEATGYIKPTNNLRYAWYPADTPDDELKPVEAGGKVYTAKKHTTTSGLGIDKPRFYTWDDSSGVTHTATNENDYKVLESKNEPVLTSETWYYYNPGAGNAVINSILGANRGWLASSYVYLVPDSKYAYFGVRRAYSGYMNGWHMCYTGGYTGALAYGLRPVISLSSKLLDIADTSSDGQTSESAWNIK